MRAGRVLFCIILTMALVAALLPINAFAFSDTATLNSDGHYQLAMTEDDMKNILEQTTGSYISLDYSGIAGITGVTVQFDLSWMVDSGKDLLLSLNHVGSLYIQNATLKEIKNIAAAAGSISFTLEKGSVITSITQAGNEVGYYSMTHPMLLSIPYNDQDNSDYAVIYRNDGTEAPKHLIPQSWSNNGRLYSLIYTTGEYGVQAMGKAGFNDTNGKWMDDAANFMAARNVITGEEQGVFAPDRHLTRAEFVVMLMDLFSVHLQGAWIPAPYNDQSDVPQWASEAVLQATAMGILIADKNNNFKPNDEITRQDMFVITYNLMINLGIIEPSEGGMILREFSDSSKISEYAYLPLLTLVQNGIVLGNQNALNPTAPATKAEAAQFLFRVLQFDFNKASKSYDNLQDIAVSFPQTPLAADMPITTAIGDVTGDKISDKVFLYGTKTADSPFIQAITLVIQDGKTGKTTDIFLHNNMGYKPTLFLGDFSGDGTEDILIRIESGGSGAFTYDYVYSFAKGIPNLLFSSDQYNNTYKYSVTYKDDYKVAITCLNNGAKYSIDIENKGEAYLNSLYDSNKKLTVHANGFVNPLSSLFPVDTDQNGVYELLAYQKVAGLYNADSICYAENYLRWVNGAFVLYNQMMGIS